jgi:hypothetical protein
MATITLTMRHTRHEGTGLSTDTKPSANYDDRIYETDTRDEYQCFGGDDWVRIGIGGAGLVQEEPLSGPVQKILITNPTSTRGVWHLAGARGIEVVLSELAASNITKFFYTLNAVDDGDADSRLLSVSVRELIYKSEKDKRLLIAAPAGNRIKRFDYKSDQATPTGTLEIYLRSGG